jgi:hypothetical protein
LSWRGLRHKVLVKEYRWDRVVLMLAEIASGDTRLK